MSRFKVVKESKFEVLENVEMLSIKGGAGCISCMKRTRKIPIKIVPTR